MKFVDRALDELAEREQFLELPLAVGQQGPQGQAQTAGARGGRIRHRAVHLCYISYQHKEGKKFFEKSEVGRKNLASSRLGARGDPPPGRLRPPRKARRQRFPGTPALRLVRRAPCRAKLLSESQFDESRVSLHRIPQDGLQPLRRHAARVREVDLVVRAI